MATKCEIVTVRGRLTRVQIVDEPELDFHDALRCSPMSKYRSPMPEHRQLRLDCSLKTESGTTVRFQSPPTGYRIMLGERTFTIHFTEERSNPITGQCVWPASHPWFNRVGSQHVSSMRSPSDANLVPKIRKGHYVTITGRVAMTRVSRNGRSSQVLTDVKLVTT